MIILLILVLIFLFFILKREKKNSKEIESKTIDAEMQKFNVFSDSKESKQRKLFLDKISRYMSEKHPLYEYTFSFNGQTTMYYVYCRKKDNNTQQRIVIKFNDDNNIVIVDDPVDKQEEGVINE